LKDRSAKQRKKKRAEMPSTNGSWFTGMELTDEALCLEKFLALTRRESAKIEALKPGQKNPPVQKIELPEESPRRLAKRGRDTLRSQKNRRLQTRVTCSKVELGACSAIDQNSRSLAGIARGVAI